MVLSQEIFLWNIKALALTVQKLSVRLKFSKNGSDSKVKVFDLGGHKMARIIVQPEKSKN